MSFMIESADASARTLLIDGDVMTGAVTAAFALPTATVTFLLTDVEGSTVAWERHPDAMRGVIARHYDILDAAIRVGTACDRSSRAKATASSAPLHGRRTRWPQRSTRSVPSRSRRGPTASS